MQTRHTLHHSLLFMLALMVPLSCLAQAYPVKPVRVVAPYPPGSSADVMGRIYAPKLTEFLGRPFIVDNRPGAAGQHRR